MMLSAILSILGSSAVGSLLGGVMAWLNKKTDLEAKRLDQEHEQRRWGHDLAIREKDIEYAKTEAQGRKDVAIVEAEGGIESARFVAIAAANEADKLDGATLAAAGKWGALLVVADALRRLIRPVVTVILVSSTLYINWLLIERFIDVFPGLGADRQFEMGMWAIAWVSGQASAVISYWFVSRGQVK